MKKAFTLIELLVVISIIALLASLMFSSLQQTKVKTKNAAAVSALIQYRNALALYYENNDGNYPILEDYGWHCLGKIYNASGPFNVNTCGFTSLNPIFNNSDLLNQALQPYINLPTVFSEPILLYPDPSIYARGAFYSCSTSINGRCTNAGIEWILAGKNQPCTIDRAIAQNYGNITICFLGLIGTPTITVPPGLP